MKRVVVYGSSGAGKSTVAARLATLRAIDHAEIDALAYEPRGGHTNPETLQAAFRAAIDGPGWVVEGMHREQLGLALAHADTFVWLDMCCRQIATNLLRRDIERLITRRVRHGRRLTVRSFVADELPFIAKTVRRFDDRRAYGQQFASESAARGASVVHLRTRADVRAFLRDVETRTDAR